jgi:5-methylcytosine-specific restriction endonuclease McrA
VTRIPESLRRLVFERAQGKCEYCLIHERYTVKRHEIDHITAEKHGGITAEANLCLSCAVCNRYKGSDLASVDPLTQQVVLLYHPRQDDWNTHFQLIGAFIEGLTPKGRATVQLLRMNDADSVDERARLIKLGRYP